MSCHRILSTGLCLLSPSRRRHTRLQGDWSSDVCSSDLSGLVQASPLSELRIVPPRPTATQCLPSGVTPTLEKAWSVLLSGFVQASPLSEMTIVPPRPTAIQVCLAQA